MGLGFAASLIGAPAFAQRWTPTKTVRIVVPASGGTVDLVARLVAPRLQEMWGQPVIAEPRPGASGNIAAALVAKALRSPSAQGSIAAAEFDIVANTPEDFGRFLQREATTWARVAQQADVKPE